MTLGHINTYRDRQYFAHEKTGHEVSEGIKQIGDTLFNTVNAGISVVQKANESTLASNQIDLSTKFLAKNNEINTKYQADPTNPQREVELKQAFDSLANQYKINPLCQKQWADIKTNVYDRYKTYNSQWVEKQQYSNIQSNLQNGYENLTNQISMLGMNGSSIDEVKLVYANGIEGLRNGAVAGLGEVTVNDFLKDANHDVMATYISALALNNPLQAQELLKREDVRNDIGRAETIEKLENYVTNSLKNQSARVAVEELGNTLRNMNSKDSENILEGRADLSKVMKFIETNKNLPEGSKDLVLGIYGIGSKTEYYYDRDKKKITKDPEGGSGRRGSSDGLVRLSKLSKTQKEGIAQDLEADLYDMFSFADDAQEKISPKKAIKQGVAQDYQNELIGAMKRVSMAQGSIDTAYNAGIITKSQRQQYMNKFISPMTDYIESKIENLDEKQGFFGTKLGYDRIKKAFSTDDIPEKNTKQIAEKKANLLMAQGYYYKALDEARKQNGFKSIYELEERLDKSQQEKLYKQASDFALNQVARNSATPEIFFKNEYPTLYAQGVKYFGVQDGNKIARRVAEKLYGADDKSKIDVQKEMHEAVKDVYRTKLTNAEKTKVKLYEQKNIKQVPKFEQWRYEQLKNNTQTKDIRQDWQSEINKYNSYLENRAKKLNVSMNDVRETAKKYKISDSEALSMLEMQRGNL